MPSADRAGEGAAAGPEHHFNHSETIDFPQHRDGIRSYLQMLRN